MLLLAFLVLHVPAGLIMVNLYFWSMLAVGFGGAMVADEVGDLRTSSIRSTGLLFYQHGHQTIC